MCCLFTALAVAIAQLRIEGDLTLSKLMQFNPEMRLITSQEAYRSAKALLKKGGMVGSGSNY
jgi:hypothetical protein